MSKKSRKRNKKILAMLALAGGAAMLGRGKGVAQGVSGSDKAAFTSDAAYKLPSKNWVTKKVAAPIRKLPIGKMRGHGSDAAILAGQDKRANVSNYIAPPVATTDFSHVGSSHPRRSGIYKTGGRVTGAAKRGFGRALMKGKK
jgi:hypothetical protein